MKACPNCGGETYDNRAKVADGWNGPMFKCKDQDNCGWVEFKKKGAGGGGGGGRGGGGGANRRAGNGGGGGAPARSQKPLAPAYFECMQVAYGALRRTLPADTPIDAMALHAATSTLFIAACSPGAPPLRAPAKAAAPPPEPADDEGGGGSDDDLPFDD